MTQFVNYYQAKNQPAHLLEVRWAGHSVAGIYFIVFNPLLGQGAVDRFKTMASANNLRTGNLGL